MMVAFSITLVRTRLRFILDGINLSVSEVLTRFCEKVHSGMNRFSTIQEGINDVNDSLLELQLRTIPMGAVSIC